MSDKRVAEPACNDWAANGGGGRTAQSIIIGPENLQLFPVMWIILAVNAKWIINDWEVLNDTAREM